MTGSRIRGGLAKLWEEVAPVANHSIVVVTLSASLVLVACLLSLLQQINPERRDQIARIETLDLMIVYGVMALYGAFVIVLVSIRLSKTLMKEWKRK